MKDRKKVLENAKRYREKNPEKIREYKKLWRKKNYSNVFTHDEWSEIVIRFNLSVRFKEIYDNHKNS